MDWVWFRKTAITVALWMTGALVTYIIGLSMFPSENAVQNYGCNVAGIELHGSLWTYIPTLGTGDDPEEYSQLYGDAVASEHVVALIHEAEQDDAIKAILLEVDSFGGLPVAGEEIARALKESTKPTVALIRTTGASAAYWAATGADQIYASENSEVGSIGVTSSFVEEINPDSKYIQLSSGKFKDIGDPDKPITEDEKQLLMDRVNTLFDNFVNAVAENRNIGVEDVRAVADGSTVLGGRAKELHLIDEIGSLPDVESHINTLIGSSPDICWM